MSTVTIDTITDEWTAEVVSDAIAVVHGAEDARRIDMSADNPAGRQGDVLLRRVSTVGRGQEVKPIEGRITLVEGENMGNDHVVRLRGGSLISSPSADPFVIGWLTTDEEAVLTHVGPSPEHGPLLVPPGTWEVRRQNEMSSGGWRRVAD